MMEPFSQFLGLNSCKLSREEKVYLEAELFVRICEKLKNYFSTQYKTYFTLIGINKEMEAVMIDKNLICWMIRDILTTDAYTLSGIAYYTETPEDVIYEIVIGQDIRPSAIFLTKIIELHKEVRQDLYQEIKRKITEEYLSAA